MLQYYFGEDENNLQYLHFAKAVLSSIENNRIKERIDEESDERREIVSRIENLIEYLETLL